MGVAITADLCGIHNGKCIVLNIKVKIIEQRIKKISHSRFNLYHLFVGSGLDWGNAHPSSESDFEIHQSR